MGDSEQVDEFVRLFTTYELRLRAYVVSLVRNYADAEDVLQEANLTLWKKFGEYQPGTNFMAWAGRVMFLKVQQHRERRSRDKLQLGEAFLNAVAREAAREEMAAELGQREQTVARCVAELRSEHRVMLMAWYDEHSTIDKMTATFNRSARAIHSSLTRIRRAVHDCVNAHLRAEV